MTESPLTAGQRALLLTCCTDHAITACAGCGRKIMLSDLFAHLWHRPEACRCPRCGHNMGESLRAHVSACPFIAGAVATRTRQTIVRERQADVVREHASEVRRRDTHLQPGLRTGPGLARCPVCHRGLSAASDIVIRDGQAMHLGCSQDQTTSAAS